MGFFYVVGMTVSLPILKEKAIAETDVILNETGTCTGVSNQHQEIRIAIKNRSV